jgi:hypothetical protein
MTIRDITKEQLETFTKESTNLTQLLQKKGKCPDCNKDIDRKATRCVECLDNLKNAINKNKTKKCLDCNISIWNDATRCKECHQKQTRKIERPSYQQLIEDKKTLTMVKIGEKYGVSDNAIRKWIKRYEKELA